MSLAGTRHSSLGEEDDEEKEGEAGLFGGSDLTLAGLKLRDGEREKVRELERGYEGVREVKLVEPNLLSTWNTRELEAATAEGEGGLCSLFPPEEPLGEKNCSSSSSSSSPTSSSCSTFSFTFLSPSSSFIHGMNL